MVLDLIGRPLCDELAELSLIAIAAEEADDEVGHVRVVDLSNVAVVLLDQVRQRGGLSQAVEGKVPIGDEKYGAPPVAGPCTFPRAF